MNDILIDIGFTASEIEKLYEKKFSKYHLEKFVILMKRFNCKKEYIKELIVNYSKILEMDLEVLEYKLEAIVSNGDMIDEVLMDLI